MLKSELGRPNTRSKAVSRLQDALRFLGHAISDPPGFYGTGTLGAVRRFQSVQRLAASDGVADAGTIDALNRQLAEEAGGSKIVRGAPRAIPTGCAISPRNSTGNGCRRWPEPM